MSNSIVHSQTKQAKGFLEDAVDMIGDYLNSTTLDGLLAEDSTGDTEYYKVVLSSLRRLYVFCEEGLDACNVILKGEKFRKAAAEKTLYWIYHQCIQEFYSPRHDKWYEDSRSAYTGKNAIKFTSTVPASLRTLMASLEKGFQELREELEFYETDYRTKIVQSK